MTKKNMSKRKQHQKDRERSHGYAVWTLCGLEMPEYDQYGGESCERCARVDRQRTESREDRNLGTIPRGTAIEIDIEPAELPAIPAVLPAFARALTPSSLSLTRTAGPSTMATR